jgi:hypothetical protein
MPDSPLLFSQILDGAVMLALAAAVLYGLRLEKRLSAFRRDKEEMHNLAASFVGATEQAQQAIMALQTAITQAEKTLHQPLKKANSVADDLQFLIERGEQQCGKIEKSLKKAQVHTPVPTVASVATASVPAAPPSRSRTSKAEQQLMEALRQK